MDDYSVGSLVESKNEWCARLVGILTPLVIEGIRSIFDEAQRAWDANKGKSKFDYEISEPEMFLRLMERHNDWAVIIALVGNGQEINTGERGLIDWGHSLNERAKSIQGEFLYIVFEILTPDFCW